MPAFRFPVAVVAALSCAAFPGCSSTSLGLDEASLSLAPGDPALPDTVEMLPSFSSEPAVAVAEAAEAAGEVVTDAAEAASGAARSVGEGVATVVASAYAGPTPDDPAAAFKSSGAKIAARSPELDLMIRKYAAVHGIPEDLMRRVVKRESTFNPAARNGPYYGLMQILPATARTMGYKGEPSGLLDAETNLMFAGKYLRGAYLTAGGNHDLAVRYYSRGYYYDAKRKGLLEETGLRPARTRMPQS